MQLPADSIATVFDLDILILLIFGLPSTDRPRFVPVAMAASPTGALFANRRHRRIAQFADHSGGRPSRSCSSVVVAALSGSNMPWATQAPEAQKLLQRGLGQPSGPMPSCLP